MNVNWNIQASKVLILLLIADAVYMSLTGFLFYANDTVTLEALLMFTPVI